MRGVVLGVVVLLVLGVVTGAVEAFRFLNFQSPNADQVVFEVVPGDGINLVARRLKREGMIPNELYFKVLARLRGSGGVLRVGEYAVPPASSPLTLLTVLSSGKSIQRQFTVPEGWNMFEIATLFAERRLVSSVDEALGIFRDKQLIQSLLGEDLDSLEGYLFPETYSYTKYDKPREIVKAMVSRFKSVYNQVTKDHGNHGFTRHQIVTLASVIEKETGAPEERPLIASVFHNRLNKGMRLQSDPTIIYGMWIESGVMPSNIRKADILRPTAYNTYTVRALPLGPIANPGKEAILATVKPDQSKYFYFVSKNDGTHVFSENLSDHDRAVKEYQLNRKAREGKSWRDLKTRSKAN